MPDLIIKISGDIKAYEDALKEAESKTENFKDAAGTVAQYSAVAFAALTAEIGFSVAAFNDAENASRQLTLALQNQGIYSKSVIADYERYAKVVSDATGIDDDNIKKSQAIAQGYLGRMKVTEDLTRAIADLAELEGGDLNAAAEKIARTIGTKTNAFARQGLELDETMTKEERLARVMEFVNQKAGGLAETVGNTAGSVRGLKTAFGDVQEEIGKRFAVQVDVGVRALTALLKTVKEKDAILDWVAALVAGGAAMSGAISVAGTLATSIVAVTNVMTAMGVAVTATRVAITLLAGATGIGLLVVALGTLGGYLLTSTQKMQEFKKNIPGATDEIKKLKDEVKELEKYKMNFALPGEQATRQRNIDEKKKQIADLERIVAEAAEAEYDQQNKKTKAADAHFERNVARDRAEAAAKEAHLQVLAAINNGASQEQIETRQRQADILMDISQSTNEREKQLLREQYAELTAIRIEQDVQEMERRQAFEEEQQVIREEMLQQYGMQNSTLTQKQLDEIRAQKMTELDVYRQIEKEKLQDKVKSDNEYLLNQKKFGTAYATIYKMMHSEVYQGTKTAFGELAQLQQSSNSTLKGIGKVAAIANIVIKTAESAMNIYAGFSTIPIIGPALGTAGAAAAIAFGAEQIGKVNAAAQGAVVKGGVPGRDSVPFMLTPGELVTPSENFEEAIGSMRAAREAQKVGGTLGGADLMPVLQEISAKLDNLGGGGNTFNVNGDVLADDGYMERLLEKISDFLEYKNGKLYGVTA